MLQHNESKQNKTKIKISKNEMVWFGIVELLGGWSGQLSLAIFTPDLELSVAQKYIKFLAHCFPNLHQQVKKFISESPHRHRTLPIASKHATSPYVFLNIV